MKNIFMSKIKLSIKGKKIERFIKKLTLEKINIYGAKRVDKNQIDIVIARKDYDKVLKLKTIYDFEILDGYGFIKIKKVLKINSMLLFLFLIGISVLFFLSNIIFHIRVIHTDTNMRKFILNELSNYGIKEKSFKKSYKELQKIKSDILNKYKDQLEWIEIEQLGTNYIIRLEERKRNDTSNDYAKRHIVAKKDAIIKKIEASNGEIVKDLNTYVKKGDTIISGNITLNENIKDIVRAEGKVYGEVWYTVNVSYPYIYYDSHETGNTKNVLTLSIFSKNIEFTFNKFKDKNSEKNILIKHLFLPISLNIEKQKEVKKVEEVNTVEQAIEKATQKASMQIQSKLNDNEKIISSKNLKVDIKDSKIELEIFFTVYEDITDYALIVEE